MKRLLPLIISVCLTGPASAQLKAPKTSTLLIDTNSNGKANPGDTLRYTVVLTNTSSTNLLNVQFNDTAFPNQTLVPGSIKATPLARDESPAANSAPGDAWHGVFNTTLTIAAAAGLLTNDFVGTPAATIASFGGGTFGGSVIDHAAGTSAVAAGVGTLTVNADGSLTLVPASTFTGTLTFQYRLANASGTSDATVTLAIGIRPAATTDAYNVTGNTMIDSSLIPQTVLVNDTGSAIGISGNTAGVNGTVTLSANGHFLFTPNAAFVGAASFTYTITNGFGPATGTVNLTVANKVWYIDNSVGANGDGRSSSPFKQTSDFTAVNDGLSEHPADNDLIFIRQGGGNYTSSATLRAGQKIIGDGSSGTLNAAFAITFASGSAKAAGTALPAFTGTDPVITPSSGNGVNLAANNTLRGFRVANNTGFGFSGGAVGSLVISETSKTGTGGAMSISNSGTFGSSVSFDTFESTSSAGANLSLSNVTGTLTVISAGSGFTGSAANFAAINISGGSVSLTYAGAVSKANAGALLNVAGGHTGTLTFNTGTLNASAGTGLQFDNADGAYNFNGTTTLNGGDAGVDILNGCAGTFTFGTSAAITSPSGIAFNVDGGATTSTCNVTYNGNITQANNAAMVSVRNHNTGTITFQTGTLFANNGTGLQFDNCDSTTSYNFNGTVTLNGGDAGIDIINGSAGTFTFGTGTTITRANSVSGAAFNLLSSDANVTYRGTMTLGTSTGNMVAIDNHDAGTITFQAGNLTKGSSTTQGISVQNCNGGTINFNNPTITITMTSGNAVSLVNNNGGAINFALAGGNGLDLTTTSGVGFNATGGGTVTVTGAGNTVNSGSGTALNVTSTTIGAGGLNFVSIAASGASSGIVLNNTGAGVLTIAGDGGGSNNGSGGVIQNSAGAGINLTTASVKLNYVNVINGGDDGIRGSSVTGLSLNRCNVTGNGNAVTERGLDLLNLFGTCGITNSTISGNAEDNLYVVNNTTPALTLFVTSSTFANTSTSIGNDGIHFRGEVGSPNMSLTVMNSTFSHNRGDHIQVTTDANNTATMFARIEGNTFSGDRGTTYGGTDLGGGITINPAGASTTTFHIRNNGTVASPWVGAVVSAITINNSALAGQTTVLQGNIINNVIGNAALIDSGSSQGDCISIFSNGNGTTTVNVANNQLRQFSNLAGLNVQIRDGAAGTINATLTGNTISNPGTFSANGLFLSAGATATDAGLLQTDILNNTLGGSGGNGSTDFRIRHRFATTIRMPGYTGALTDTAAVVTYLQGRNTGAETGSATVNTTAPIGGQFQNTSPPGSAVPLPPAP